MNFEEIEALDDSNITELYDNIVESIAYYYSGPNYRWYVTCDNGRTGQFICGYCDCYDSWQCGKGRLPSSYGFLAEAFYTICVGTNKSGYACCPAN